jgi:DNA-binding NtrC family response regulator
MPEPMKVLFVDDEPDFLQTLLKRMRKRDVNAAGVGSGEEALVHLAQFPADVVVLDVRMPGMGGIETLRAIKKKTPLTEVVMLTGHASLEVAREGMENGAFDYLMKPVDIDDLLYKIQDAFHKKTIQEAKIKTLNMMLKSESSPRE